MRILTLLSAAALLSASACSTQGLVEVTVDAPNAIANVDSLQVQLENAGMLTTVPGGVAVPTQPYTLQGSFPFVLQFNGRAGALMVTVNAVDSSMKVLATGTMVTTINEGGTTSIMVTLGGATAIDGGPDLRSIDGGGIDMAGIDGAMTPDEAMTIDMAMPDLEHPDIAMVDLAKPDLAMPDLAVPDLAVPDLAMPDLAMSDLAMPDLITCPSLTFTRTERPQSGATDVAVADFNRDGVLDMVVSRTNDQTVTVFFGTGGGSFGTGTDYNRPIQGPGTSQPVFLIAGDFNSDGAPDFAIGYGASNNVLVYLNQGTGTFTTPSTYNTVGGSPQWIAQGDVNNDGAVDLVTANSGYTSNGTTFPPTVSVLLGINTSGTGSHGTGAFPATATNITAAVNPASLALVDVDGDGNLDIVTTNPSTNNLSVLLGTGSGSFAAATTLALPSGATSPHGLSAFDLNHDGKADFVVACTGSNNVAVLMNTSTTGSVSATSASYKTTATFPSWVLVDDLDADGNDQVVVGGDAAAVSIFTVTPSTGALTLVNTIAGPSTVAATSGGIISSIAAGDLNNDARLDLVLTYQGAATGQQPTISTLLNATSTSTCPQTAATCVSTLSGVHYNDYTIGFSVTLSSSVANGSYSLVNQRLACTAFTGWDILSNKGKVGVEIDRLLTIGSSTYGDPDIGFAGSNAIDNGSPHTVLLTRTSAGLAALYVDNVVNQFASGALQDFSTLPPVSTTGSPCSGATALGSNGSVSGLCLHE